MLYDNPLQTKDGKYDHLAPYRRDGNPARYRDIVRGDDEQTLLDPMVGLVSTASLSPELQTWRRGSSIVTLIATSDQVNIGGSANDLSTDRLQIEHSGLAGLRLKGNPGGYLILRNTAASADRWSLRTNGNQAILGYSSTSDDPTAATPLLTITGGASPSIKAEKPLEAADTLIVPRKADPGSPSIGELWVSGTLLKFRDNNSPTQTTRTLVDTTRTISTTSPITGGGDLSADRTLGFDQSVALNNNARVAVAKGGALVGTRRRINLIEGSNITLTVADDAANEEVDVTITSAGGAGASEALLRSIQGGRLSLDWMTPTPAFDSTGSAGVYLVPYISDTIGLYDGTTWKVFTFNVTNAALSVSEILACNTTNGSTTVTIPGGGARKLIVNQTVTGAGIQAGTRISAINSDTQITISLAATATQTGVNLSFSTNANKNVDVFAFVEGTTVRLEGKEWTDNTTRATALAYQDGVLVLSGTPTRRYLGTFRTTVAGQFADSKTKRFLWNYYHRVRKVLEVYDTTDSWTYGTAAWRAINNNTANRVEFVIGVSEDPVYFVYYSGYYGAGGNVATGIGLDRTDGNDAVVNAATRGYSGGASPMLNASIFNKLVTAGYHYLQLVEYAGSSMTQWGDDAGAIRQFGASGWIFG